MRNEVTRLVSLIVCSLAGTVYVMKKHFLFYWNLEFAEQLYNGVNKFAITWIISLTFKRCVKKMVDKMLDWFLITLVHLFCYCRDLTSVTMWKNIIPLPEPLVWAGVADTGGSQVFEIKLGCLCPLSVFISPAVLFVVWGNTHGHHLVIRQPWTGQIIPCYTAVIEGTGRHAWTGSQWAEGLQKGRKGTRE